MIIAAFFVCHWYLSAFCQTFFLHRYSAHSMFRLSKFWERTFFVLTAIGQGSSFLSPRAYALLHRMHHAYSDTEKDPHSPVYFRNPVSMMWNTLLVYMSLSHRRRQPEAQFEGGYPEWPAFERIADAMPVRLAWVGLYVAVYAIWATAWWQWMLLPVNIFMGPIHGAIVNWCGHKYGYANYDNHDQSKNTLIFDFLCLGELFQNNHHKDGTRLHFAHRWFEMDPTYVAIRFLDKLGIVRLKTRP